MPRAPAERENECEIVAEERERKVGQEGATRAEQRDCPGTGLSSEISHARGECLQVHDVKLQAGERECPEGEASGRLVRQVSR